jgi:hypothetical protein
VLGGVAARFAARQTQAGSESLEYKTLIFLIYFTVDVSRGPSGWLRSIADLKRRSLA